MVVSRKYQTLDLALKHILEGFKGLRSKKPFLVGISGAQGSGKTTLTRELQNQLSQPPHNLRVASFSLDDFYLSRDEQANLNQLNHGNRLLEFRGNPGTHDLNLLQQTLDQLGGSNPGTVSIPTYNKIAFCGLGDRNPQHLWTKVQLPIDIILFEGWMLGFQPLSSLALSEMLEKDYAFENHTSCFRNYPSGDVSCMNKKLASYSQLWAQLSTMVMLYPEKLEYIYSWRLEQEPKGGLSSDQVRDFVDRFMPAYELYLKDVCERKGGLLKIVLGSSRNVKYVGYPEFTK
ncbi:hypothetical protein DSO57_1010943 [Entomophthora muscae]|uniref:Uncharacterized protein n=1 Tax=Entomophthora muscae TaxID=34485 RepID=A0ACC2TH50_9FUNG|nr:hypothetical protein DSO57_1010943 [Entomophthora muscae]